MNCKQGDLAIVVNSLCGNEGKIVRCLRLLPAHRWEFPDGSIVIKPSWEIDISLPSFDGSCTTRVADDRLRPIRDPGDDAVDETLLWKQVPKPTEAA